jgi:hypothetical protein
VAAGAYLVVSWQSGYLAHPTASVFGSPDSHEYRQVADWIFGARGSADASAWRPFLYPVILGLADRVGGAAAVWFLNLAMWFAALNIAAAAAYRLVKNEWAAILAFLALATNASLILLTYQALTEIITVALIATWIYGLSHLTARPGAAEVVWALLPLTLLVVLKPEFELLLGVMAIVLVVLVWRNAARGAAGVAFAACLLPVAIQLAVMVTFNHYFGISTIGDSTIRGYFLARLYMTINHTGDFNAARQQVIGLGNAEAARLALGHAGDAIAVFITTLKDNLLAGSNFILPDANRHLNSVIVWTNRAYALMLVVLIPLAAAALWRARDGRLALLGLGTLNVFLSGGLSFYQGDRLTVIALPLWSIAGLLALREALSPGAVPRPAGDPNPRRWP